MPNNRPRIHRTRCTRCNRTVIGRKFQVQIRLIDSKGHSRSETHAMCGECAQDVYGDLSGHMLDELQVP